MPLEVLSRLCRVNVDRKVVKYERWKSAPPPPGMVNKTPLPHGLGVLFFWDSRVRGAIGAADPSTCWPALPPP
jgi:hypothetical protein